MDRKHFTVNFEVAWYWEGDQLVLECDTPAERDYVARALEEKPVIITVKKQR